jgi:hypothetical protein
MNLFPRWGTWWQSIGLFQDNSFFSQFICKFMFWNTEKFPTIKDPYVLCIRVGWYWNWDKSTPDVCYIPFKSNANKRKKCFDPVTASSLGKTFWVMHYIEKYFFTIWTSWVSIDAEIYVHKILLLFIPMKFWTLILCMTQEVVTNDEEVIGSKKFFL